MLHVSKLIIMFAGLMMLVSCTNVMMSGAQAVYNRHSLQKNFTDQYITMQAFKTLEIDEDRFKNTHIVIATYHQEVLLTGQVPEAWQKSLAGELVNKIPNIKKVYNLISVASPTSSLTRLSDSWITGKVKARFLASNAIESNQIKVVTENGTVYLMGIVPLDEANEAVDITRNIAGVRSVVKIFSYLTILNKEEKNLENNQEQHPSPARKSEITANGVQVTAVNPAPLPDEINQGEDFVSKA